MEYREYKLAHYKESTDILSSSLALGWYMPLAARAVVVDLLIWSKLGISCGIHFPPIFALVPLDGTCPEPELLVTNVSLLLRSDHFTISEWSSSNKKVQVLTFSHM
jgi:hypothetical protein